MFISGGAQADEDEWFAWTSHSTSDRDDDGEKDSITFYFAPRTDESEQEVKVVFKVYDGDTITIATKICNLPNLYRFSVRILDIDCPEINSKDDFEKELAIKGRDYVKPG